MKSVWLEEFCDSFETLEQDYGAKLGQFKRDIRNALKHQVSAVEQWDLVAAGELNRPVEEMLASFRTAVARMEKDSMAAHLLLTNETLRNLGQELGEQGLDLDLDVVVAELSPTTTLTQSAGRLNRTTERGGARIYKPPGSLLRSIADFFFSKKTFEAVFEQTVADLQLEYIEALSHRRRWKALWVWMRGVYTFWAAFIEQLPIPLLKRISGLLRGA